MNEQLLAYTISFAAGLFFASWLIWTEFMPAIVIAVLGAIAYFSYARKHLNKNSG